MRKTISIAIPVFNEEANIDFAYQRIIEQIERYKDCYDFEFVFTDNHSTDRSFELLRALAEKDPRIRIIRFSKNFGYQNSVYTAVTSTTGDAVIQIDCDMQDPPELFHAFIKHWEQGYKVIYGVRRSRTEKHQLLRKLFYRMINYLSEEPLPLDAADFRLTDKVIVDLLRKIGDTTIYLRGTIAGLGYQQLGISYDRGERVHGDSQMKFKQLFKLAMDGVFNQSYIPLQLATIFGVVVAFITLLASIGYLVAKLFFHPTWPVGLASTMILLFASIGLNSIFMGIIGNYVGRIYKQVRNHPRVVVEDTINLNSQP